MRIPATQSHVLLGAHTATTVAADKATSVIITVRLPPILSSTTPNPSAPRPATTLSAMPNTMTSDSGIPKVPPAYTAPNANTVTSPSLYTRWAMRNFTISPYRRMCRTVCLSSASVPPRWNRAPGTGRSLTHRKSGRLNSPNHAATNTLVARTLKPSARVIPNHGVSGCTNPTNAMTMHTSPPTYPTPQPYPDTRPMRSGDAMVGRKEL